MNTTEIHKHTAIRKNVFVNSIEICTQPLNKIPILYRGASNVKCVMNLPFLNMIKKIPRLNSFICAVQLYLHTRRKLRIEYM